MSFLPDEFARLVMKFPERIWMRRHLLLVVAFAAIGLTGFFVLSLLTNNSGWALLLLLPINVIGLAFGAIPGILGALLFSFVAGIFLDATGISAPPSVWFALTGTLILMITGGTVGYFSAMATEYRSTRTELTELRHILPICAKCKKVRNDDGYWQQVEEYISLHTDIEFNHGLCDDCLEELSREVDRESPAEPNA